MDCHLNCHGELNALVASFPLVAYALVKIRARWRAWKARG